MIGSIWLNAEAFSVRFTDRYRGMAMSEVLTEEEIVTAWGNSNFGPKGDTHEGRLELLGEAIEKVHCGYEPGGSFMTTIVSELGLVKTHVRYGRFKYSLLSRGKDLLIEFLHRKFSEEPTN